MGNAELRSDIFRALYSHFRIISRFWEETEISKKRDIIRKGIYYIIWSVCSGVTLARGAPRPPPARKMVPLRQSSQTYILYTPYMVMYLDLSPSQSYWLRRKVIWNVVGAEIARARA